MSDSKFDWSVVESIPNLGSETSMEISLEEVTSRWPDAIDGLESMWEDMTGESTTQEILEDGVFTIEDPGVTLHVLNLTHNDDWQVMPGKILAYSDSQVACVYIGNGEWHSID